MALAWENGKVVDKQMPPLTKKQFKKLEKILDSDKYKDTYLDRLVRTMKFPKPVRG